MNERGRIKYLDTPSYLLFAAKTRYRYALGQSWIKYRWRGRSASQIACT